MLRKELNLVDVMWIQIGITVMLNVNNNNVNNSRIKYCSTIKIVIDMKIGL